MTPTIQQQAFLDALLETTSNLALIARAGCGKTSTILMAVSALVQRFPHLEILVCAFNKAIAAEVATKLKAAGHADWKKVQASTLHAMGFNLLRFVFKNVKVDDKKVRNLIDAQNSAVYVEYRDQIAQLVRFAKQAGFGFFPDLPISNTQAWHDLADHYDVNGLEDTSLADDLVMAAQHVYKLSLAQTDVVDFDDMILFPLIKNLRVKFGKDVIMLDEAQDLSRARQALARKFLRPRTGRMIVVGDDRQAIYGFTGADAAALPNLVQALDATVLPLSVTWRCPRAVVSLAQQLVPDIEAAPEAPEGEVINLSIKDAMEGIQRSDAILCRNTAPLITLAYKLIRAGKPCKVEGRSIGDGLKNLVLRWKITTIDQLLQRLEAYQDREVQKAQAKGNEAKVEEVMDRCQTLVEICEGCIQRGQRGVSDVVEFIDQLFADGATNVTVLATYHRSKGREWPRVMLLEHSQRCPSRAARQDWQMQQEKNLAYVAVTRAQQTLAFIQ